MNEFIHNAIQVCIPYTNVRIIPTLTASVIGYNISITLWKFSTNPVRPIKRRLHKSKERFNNE